MIGGRPTGFGGMTIGGSSSGDGSGFGGGMTIGGRPTGFGGVTIGGSSSRDGSGFGGIMNEGRSSSFDRTTGHWFRCSALSAQCSTFCF
jgi:hypothetical protein